MSQTPQRYLSCAICAVQAARQRLSGRSRLAPRGRLGRLVRNTAVALTIGGLAAVPFVEMESAGPADARGASASAPAAKDVSATSAKAAGAGAGGWSIVPLPSPKLPRREVGYQLATDAGDVLPFGAAASGAAPAQGLANPVVSVARTPSGAGAWTATADGGVLTSGDALFYGSLGGQRLNRPVVGLAATPSGKGYWLVSADGGVFAFGDAGFFGSLVGVPLNAPVSALVPTPGGGGYWLVSRDGGVFTFGDAPWHGSLDVPLIGGVVGMAATPSGDGYWLVGSDGGVFSFGGAGFFGRPASSDVRTSVVGIAASRTGKGYWLASADGGVFTYGDAPFLGSTGGSVWGRVVGIAAGTGRPVSPLQKLVPMRLRNRYGHDISWPQCDGPFPNPGYGYAVIGVTGGRPFTRNRCLAEQWQWATAGASGGSVYINLASPLVGEGAAMHGPAGACGIHDLPCQVYNHSANNVVEAVNYARASGVDSPMWWLDVETLNRWSANPGLNALTVKAAAETLQKLGLRVGVYSTPYMWRVITGGDQNGLPVWVAGAPTDADAPSWCTNPQKNFTGGGVWMVQSLPIQYDVNYACDPMLPEVAASFRFG
jgi:hypothetical protein